MCGCKKLKQIYLPREAVTYDGEIKKWKGKLPQWLAYIVALNDGDPSELIDVALNTPLDKKHMEKLQEALTDRDRKEQHKKAIEEDKLAHVSVPGDPLEEFEFIEV